MAEAVKVIVRCRPLNQREKDLKCKVIVEMNNEFGECCLTNPEDPSAPAKSFTFDGAYYIDSTTEQIYNEIVFPLVESVTEGYNGTVFAYGQTGCGKSFSMQGVPKPPTQRGVIPRAFEHIFEAISAASNTKFLVHASYLEIYNEDIRDLLGSDTKKKLDLKESSDSGVYVAGLSMIPVHNVSECESIMDRGWKSRAVGATLMNADSSRSHSIFTVYLERMTSNESDDGNIRKGKLNLVDLAGSERQAKTGATGDRLKEATKINLSLSALGNVISALVDGKSKHIPYRDSKLTRLLQDSLGGNTKTLMIACLSPADNNYDETLSTLRYANRAKNIKNKPRVNEDPKDALLREYQEEIRRLKALITDQTVAQPTLSPSDVVTSPASASFANETGPSAEEAEKIRQEYDQKLQDLLAKFEQEQESNEKLKSEMNALKASYTDEKGQPPPTAMVHASEAIERLAALEDYMVGGEKANDPEINEKRARRKRIAEKKINAISEALKNFDNDDQLLLKAYGDITEELRARTLLLKKAKKKIISLEREVSDLQSEFEQDRTDYLETIRRLEQQVKLYTQIIDKVQPCIRRDCNYSNLDRIKADCVWDEDLQKWRLPDLIVTRTKLPPTSAAPGINGSNGTRNYTSDLGSTAEHGESDGTTGSPGNGVTDGNTGENDSITDSHSQSSSPSDPSSIGDKLLQKLQRGMNETLAANYFKSKRRDALLNKNVSSPAVVTGIHSSSLANGHVPGNINNGTSSGKGNIASHLINNANNNNNTSNNNYLSKDNNKVSKGFHGRSNGNITLTHNIANGADGSAKLTNANNNSTTNANVNQLINGSLNGNNNLVKHPPHPHPPAPVSPVSRATSGGLFQLNGLVNSTSPSFTGRPSNFIHSSALNEFTNRSSISSSLSTLKQMPKQQVNSSNSAVERGHLTHLNLAVTGGQATVNGITHNLNQLNNLSLKPIDGMSGLNGSFISSSASSQGDSAMSNKNKLFTLRNGHSGHSTSGTNGNSGNNKMVKSLEPEPTKNTGFTNVNSIIPEAVEGATGHTLLKPLRLESIRSGNKV